MANILVADDGVDLKTVLRLLPERDDHDVVSPATDLSACPPHDRHDALKSPKVTHARGLGRAGRSVLAP
jgi:hypothetical protein